MYILTSLLFGLVVGAVARLVAPGGKSRGWAVSISIGVLGSLVGGFLARSFDGDGGRAVGFLFSVFGAVVLLVAYHAISRRERST